MDDMKKPDVDGEDIPDGTREGLDDPDATIPLETLCLEDDSLADEEVLDVG